MAKTSSFPGFLTVTVVGAALLATPNAAAQSDRFVIPPGNEKLFGAMLCDEATQPPLPAGCLCQGVSIDHSFAVGTYACADAPAVKVELRHPSVPEGAAKTASFALVPRGAVPPALLSALETRVKAGEASWKWVEAVAAPSNNEPKADVVAPTVPALRDKPAGVPDAEWAEYQAGVALYNAGRHEQALAAMTKMARAKPVPMAGVLGIAVASLASTSPTQETVARYIAIAEKDPGDVVNQFLAGVSAHYCAHRQGRTREEKNELYVKAIKYLQRTLPQYEREARVHIYLGVSHFRLGQQAEAETQIEKAVALGSNDADSFYCRAEVYHRKDRAKAIADIEMYISISEAMAKREGSTLSESKQRRVRDMLAALKSTPPGAAPPGDLWDPVLSSTASLANPYSPKLFGAVMLAVAGAAAAIWLVVARRAKRRPVEPTANDSAP